MSRRAKTWLIGSLTAVAITSAVLFAAGVYISRQFEPYIREQAILYLEQRFDSKVQLRALHINVPRFAPLKMIRGDGPVIVTIEGEGFVLHYKGRTDLPPLFVLPRFSATVDLRKLFDDQKTVPLVELYGMELNMPRKPKQPETAATTKGKSKAKAKGKQQPEPPPPPAETPKNNTNVIVERVLIHDAMLAMLPRDPNKQPLRFDLHEIELTSAGKDVPMNYKAKLTNAKPPGEIDSTGTFGPWAADDPSATPLAGTYVFENADLSVFNGIAGILHSTGEFQGQLGAIVAKGTATVPDFRLKMSGNPVPLSTSFEVHVDGTNGNTELKPVKARLGSTDFTTSGAILRYEGDARKTIDLDADMPRGSLTDVLTLAMKGEPFMKGNIALKTKIKIPPLSGKVKEKLELDGAFEITQGVFLKSTIQDQIDSLSRRGQGQPKNAAIDEVVSRMTGDFVLLNEVLTFHSLAFAVEGAVVNLSGLYDMDMDTIDFHGALALDAKVSQTQTGWKRWVLKPADPFFAKNGAGTYLKIKVVGSSKKPSFGLDR